MNEKFQIEETQKTIKSELKGEQVELEDAQIHQTNKTIISVPRATQTNQNSLFNQVTGGRTTSNRSSLGGQDEVLFRY